MTDKEFIRTKREIWKLFPRVMQAQPGPEKDRAFARLHALRTKIDKYWEEFYRPLSHFCH